MNSAPVFVHTDIARLDRRLFRNLNSDTEIVQAAIEYLKDLNRDQEIWLPSFNYSFAQTRIFDVMNDVSEVGIINETLRRNADFTRSEVPTFSIIRNRPNSFLMNVENSAFEPFGPNGEFAELFNRNGKIMFLGANISSLTHIHRIEELVDIKYRYYKNFHGEIHNGGSKKKINLRFKVRPRGMELQYDWEKINSKINQEGIMQFQAKNVFVLKVVDLHDFLIQELLTDELWMLTQESRKKVHNARNLLGREYEIGDFE